MSYATHSNDFMHYHGETSARHQVQARPGILRRLYRALHAYRQREADREIVAFMARSGGRFTDSMERELSARTFTGDWQRRHAGL